MLEYIGAFIKSFHKTIKDTKQNEVTTVEECKENNIDKSNILQNNDTLLVSETINKVILPYTINEVNYIVADTSNNYNTQEEVINNIFTRPFTDFKFQFISRYNETIKLVTQREKYGMMDAVPLAIEMMGKRYLHPAIISACRNLNELNVYLDCLDKNELDDFKIFKIKYELHPFLIKQENSLYVKNNFITKIWDYVKKFFVAMGKRYNSKDTH